MKKYEQLIADLKAILKKNPRLTWMSEGDEQIEVVKIAWYRVMRWKQEKDGEAEDRLQKQVDMSENDKGMQALAARLLSEPRIISIKRPTKEKAVFELYILAYMSFHYVGVKTRLIET